MISSANNIIIMKFAHCIIGSYHTTLPEDLMIDFSIL